MRTKDYKTMSKERLLSAIDESERNSIEPSGSKNNFINVRIKKVREDFNELRGKLLKQKIKDIRRNLNEIENKKNLSNSKIKQIQQNLLELEESLFKLNKYHDYDDNEYRGIRDVRSLFNQFDKDYYKSIRTEIAFNGTYIEYESKGHKDKTLPPKECFDMIKPYLSDIITIIKHLKI